MIEITEGDGKAQVYNGTQWVEANGYVFSQKTQNLAQGQGYALHLSDQKVKMRRVATTGAITLKFSKGSDADFLYFWGTERWNGATIFITNVARAGRYLELLHNNFKNDVVERKPDLILFEIPLINEYSNYSQVGYQTVVNHVHDYIFGDRAVSYTHLDVYKRQILLGISINTSASVKDLIPMNLSLIHI